MKNTDINKYTGTPIVGSNSQKNRNKKATSNIIKSTVKTLLAIVSVTFIFICIAVIAFIIQSSKDTMNLDLRSLKLNLTSFVYVNDEHNIPQQYQQVNSTETRVWVDYGQMPQAIKDAIVAIEDKRFYNHMGIDWRRTSGATFNYLIGRTSYGGSTITQQMIKNITNKKEVSTIRKLSEMLTAFIVETKYSKDEILETYLNVVNFGGGKNGVEAAANLYFGKSISECDIAECAAIAGITQNPNLYNPLLHPEENKTRQQTVLSEMYNQGMISKEEYNQAIEESENMQFKDDQTDTGNNVPIDNWYMEAMFKDITKDLSELYSVDEATAQHMLMHGGFKIYSAMDTYAQSVSESVILNNEDKVLPSDEKIQVGYMMMDYDGRILSSVGQRGEKKANLLWDCANTATRQPGSSIKPISIYAPALERKIINYSSKIADAPLKNIPGQNGAWPPNWYGYYKGNMLIPKALEISSNAVAAQVLDKLTLENSFEFLTKSLGFSKLNAEVDLTYSGLATGGGYNGVTVREMTGAFQIFGSDGVYNEPYTYFYIEDYNGNIILDNRTKKGNQAISSGNSTIMRRLLYNPIQGREGTGRAASISGWDIFGKTGTTNEDENSWFIGGSPYAVAGIWTGYETPKRMKNTSAAINIWKTIMSKYLSNKTHKSFIDDPQVLALPYYNSTGMIAENGSSGNAIGYYLRDNLPGDYSLFSSGLRSSSYYYNDDDESEYNSDSSHEPDSSSPSSRTPSSSRPSPSSFSSDVIH